MKSFDLKGLLAGLSTQGDGDDAAGPRPRPPVV
jgi:hypothetical protein